jgi:hypothetical protein
VTVGLMSGDLLAAVGNGLDQIAALVVDAQGGLVYLNSDDLAGVEQPDLDRLAVRCPRGRTRYAASGLAAG